MLLLCTVPTEILVHKLIRVFTNELEEALTDTRFYSRRLIMENQNCTQGVIHVCTWCLVLRYLRTFQNILILNLRQYHYNTDRKSVLGYVHN